MDEFDPRLFENLQQAWRFREGPLRDLKAELPIITGRGRYLESLRDFIKDMIAFANTTRRRDEPAYILYGVKNDGEIMGIRGQCTQSPLPEDWDDDDPEKFDHQQNETIGRQLHQAVEHYVRGGIEFDYLAGQLENGLLVGYIQIRPGYTSRPFEVKQELTERTTGRKLLCRGDCWKREGESNVKVPENEKEFLYNCREYPYIPRQQWLNYLEQLAREMQPDEDEIYFPLMTIENEGNLLDEEVEKFLTSQEQQVLLIEGRPGIGKTTFVRRLVATLARQTSISLKTDEQPQGYVPVVFNLKGFTDEPLDKQIALGCFSIFQLKARKTPERILLDRNIQFLICLDGFDEMDIQERNSRAIDRTLKESKGSNLKVIITSRPEALPPQWQRDYGVLHIAPFSEDQVFDYMNGKLENSEGIYEFLYSETELFELIRIPLLLKKTVDIFKPDGSTFEELEEDDFFPEANDPLAGVTVGDFIYKIFEGLLDHEEEKVLSYDRWQKRMVWYLSLGQLAFWIDGRPNKSASLRKGQEFLGTELQAVLNLGILQRDRRNSLRFSNLLALAFFAALEIDRILKEEDDGLTKILKKISGDPEFWHRCLNLLSDLSPEKDISSLRQKFLTLEGAENG